MLKSTKERRDFVVPISSGLLSLQLLKRQIPSWGTGLIEELRDKHEDSIKLIFEIPIVFVNNRKGAKHIFIDHERLPFYLNLHQPDMIALREIVLIQPEAPVKIPKLRIDYTACAHISPFMMISNIVYWIAV